MSRTGSHILIIFFLLGTAYYMGKSSGINETGNSCIQTLERIQQRIDRITDDG